MDSTHTELSALLAEPPKYAPPNLIDEELSRLIARRGARQWQENAVRLALAFCLGGFIGGLATTTILNHFLPAILGAVLLFGWVIGALRAHAVTSAYRQRRYDRAFKLLPDALSWNATWSPFTVVQFLQCQFCEINMLLLEGRALELELISRFTWAGFEGRAVSTGVPKNWAVANNLAIAWMLQLKYEEAAKMFAHGLSKKLAKRVRLVLLNNLAICQVYSHQIDEAEKTLGEAFQLLGSQTESHPGARLIFIRGLIELERSNLNAAAKSLEEAEAINNKKNGTKDFQAQCMAVLARVRQGQGRLDESELHFRNAIDLLAASDNPHYISLSEHLHYYARLLMDQGNVEGAEKQVARAQRYYDFYVDRETLAVNHFRARLNNRKRIRASAELLTLAKRERLLEARD